MAKVSEKYSSAKENNQEKLIISNGAYAVCEMLEQIINELRKTRTS